MHHAYTTFHRLLGRIYLYFLSIDLYAALIAECILKITADISLMIFGHSFEERRKHCCQALTIRCAVQIFRNRHHLVDIIRVIFLFSETQTAGSGN